MDDLAERLTDLSESVRVVPAPSGHVRDRARRMRRRQAGSLAAGAVALALVAVVVLPGGDPKPTPIATTSATPSSDISPPTELTGMPRPVIRSGGTSMPGPNGERLAADYITYVEGERKVMLTAGLATPSGVWLPITGGVARIDANTAAIVQFVPLDGEVLALADSGYASVIALTTSGERLFVTRFEPGADGPPSPPQLVADVTTLKSVEIADEGVPAFAELFFLSREVGNDVELDAIASVDGRTQQRWPLGVSHLPHLTAAFLDGGDSVFFFAVDRTLYRLAASGAPSVIAELPYPVAALTWVPDHLVVSTGSADGNGRFVRYDINGSRLEETAGFADRLVTGSDPGVALWGVMPTQPPGQSFPGHQDVSAYTADGTYSAGMSVEAPPSRGWVTASQFAVWGGEPTGNVLVRVRSINS